MHCTSALVQCCTGPVLRQCGVKLCEAYPNMFLYTICQRDVGGVCTYHLQAFYFCFLALPPFFIQSGGKENVGGGKEEVNPLPLAEAPYRTTLLTFVVIASLPVAVQFKWHRVKHKEHCHILGLCNCTGAIGTSCLQTYMRNI